MFPMSGVGFMGRRKSGPITSGLITLEFDDILNAPVADPTDVADWNTLFNLPTLGTEFTSVSVTGDIVELLGGANITLQNNIFGSGTAGGLITYLTRFIDTDCVVTMTGASHFRGQVNLSICELPVCTLISNQCFRNAGLINAFFPEVTTIEGLAFRNLEKPVAGLVSINLPMCTTADENANFAGQNNLLSAALPSLTATTVNMFQGCSKLSSISLPLAAIISQSAFELCTLLTNANIPSATSINQSAFRDCTSLTGVTAPLVETIGLAAFRNTSNVPTFNFPACTSVASTAFVVFTNINTVTKTILLPICTTIAGVQVFRNRLGLETLDFGSCTQLGATTGNDNLFQGISGNTIEFTLPVGTRTDGDATALAAANTVTFLP